MEAEALKAIFRHLKSLDILPLYWPNIKSKKIPTKAHFRVTVMPTTPDKLALCGDASKHNWILQVGIYVKEGVGQIVPAQYADSLRAGIPVGTVLTSGSFSFHTEKQGEVINAVQSADGWYFVPVQFQVSIFN